MTFNSQNQLEDMTASKTIESGCLRQINLHLCELGGPHLIIQPRSARRIYALEPTGSDHH